LPRVSSFPVAVEDVRDSGIECTSAACDDVLEPGTELTNEFVYLVVENKRKTNAKDVEVEFASTTPDNTDVSFLEHLFACPGGNGTFREQFIGIARGRRLIIPLASVVTIVDKGGYRRFIGIGETRKPVTIYWRDIFHDGQREATIDSPADSPLERLELGVLVGG
jgi:hypothetical protein